jgi:hypothetical protein
MMKKRAILRGFGVVLHHQTVTTKQIEDYLSQEVGIDLLPLINTYEILEFPL